MFFYTYLSLFFNRTSLYRITCRTILSKFKRIYTQQLVVGLQMQMQMQKIIIILINSKIKCDLVSTIYQSSIVLLHDNIILLRVIKKTKYNMCMHIFVLSLSLSLTHTHTHIIKQDSDELVHIISCECKSNNAFYL